MPASNEFVDHVLELLAPLGAVSARRMFGGYGVYHRDRMFALIAGDTLYLKIDERSRPEYAARGLEPFSYRRRGRVAVMSYCQAPPEALDDSDSMCDWARRALAALPPRPGARPRRRRRGD